MAFELPKPEIEQGFEDTQGIEDNIDVLYDKFIAPIEEIRSIAQPPPDFNQPNQAQPKVIQNLSIDSANKLESRCHAFLRLLGFPVVGNGTAYYNAGYDPNPSSEQVRSSVNNKVTEENKKLMASREKLSRDFRQMFSAQGFDTTIYGLSLLVPKSFNIIDDKQTEIDLRSISIEDFKTGLDEEMINSLAEGASAFAARIGYPHTSVKHILKPFMIDPAIDYTVMPVNNKLAVPFLKDKNATKINKDSYLSRPGIEFIIRNRLKDLVPDKIFFANLEKTITKEKEPTTAVEDSLDLTAMRETISAFAGEAELKDVDLQDVFGSFTSTQAIIVKQLIKTIKVCIKLLRKAIDDLAIVRTNASNGITFLPISSSTGYENGKGSNREVTGTDYERNITLLEIKKLYAEQDTRIEQDLGTFATAAFVNLQKVDVITKELESKEEQKTEVVTKALQALKTIEIITGESSGLGLVDILAIYTALWTISIDDLLLLLDQASIERLYNFNVSLRSDAVTKRKNNPGNIEDALKKLEEKIVNILIFADKLYGESFFSVQAAEGGSPE